jgi:DNA-binding NarL/FixJ family response regulator
MVTMHDNNDYVLEAIKAGAAGYVLKDASRTELLAAVHRVMNDELRSTDTPPPDPDAPI